jgi:hypothetical protein
MSGWLGFGLAALEIEGRLGVSPGMAKQRLRALCADKTVQARKGILWVESAGAHWVEPPIIALPHEWERAIDLVFDVDVLEADFRYWLNQQPIQGNPREIAIAKALRTGMIPGKHMPWKEFAAFIRKECGARPNARGFSVKQLRRIVRKAGKGHLNVPSTAAMS